MVEQGCAGAGLRRQGSDLRAIETWNSSWATSVAANASLRTLLFTAFFVLCGETIFSVPYRSVQLATRSHTLPWVAGGVTLAIAGLLYSRCFTVFGWTVKYIPIRPNATRAWKISWLAIGLLLRVLWVAVLPAPLRSDSLVYFHRAKDLVERHAYAGTFWPPGYPLFLSPFLRIFGSHQWAVTVSSFLLFVVTYWITAHLAQRMGGEWTVRVALVLVAIWPGYLTLIGVGAKELLLGALLPGAVLAYLSAGEGDKGNPGLLILAGVLTGWAILSQPANLLFPAIYFGYEVIRGKINRQSVRRLILVAASMTITILPWTVRTYLVYGRVVLVTTNGGSVFYRANNPKANANYIPEGERKLSSDEFEADKEGYRLAFSWIRSHPGAFLILCLRKQVAYLGDDSIGFYETLKRSLAIEKGYFFAKMTGNGFWLVLWWVLFLEARRLRKAGTHRINLLLCMLPLLLQWAIDSIFESEARHHVPHIVFLAVLIGAALSPNFAASSWRRIKGRAELVPTATEDSSLQVASP